jgi:hypothetical protein
VAPLVGEDRGRLERFLRLDGESFRVHDSKVKRRKDAVKGEMIFYDTGVSIRFN